MSQCLIIRKYDVHTSNSLQDIKHNHWTMKYRSVTYIYYEVKGHVPLTHYPKECHLTIKKSSRYKAKSMDHEM